jgi:protein-S-isoprenylcysteine O-methyltransferase Ste14
MAKMIILDQRILGTVMLILLGLLVTIKWVATGSILDKPEGSLLTRLVNIFNLFFLLILNPLAAALLVLQRMPAIKPEGMFVGNLWISVMAEITGLVVYISGYLLMAWALGVLGRNYQLGGSAPRAEDQMIIAGPYRLVRHPMYTAALSISLGLALLMHAWVLMGIFCIYLTLIFMLIPMEENGLWRAYGRQYSAYRQKTWRLLPFIY